MDNAEEDEAEQIVPNQIDKQQESQVTSTNDAWDYIAQQSDSYDHYPNGGQSPNVVVQSMQQLDGFLSFWASVKCALKSWDNSAHLWLENAANSHNKFV